MYIEELILKNFRGFTMARIPFTDEGGNQPSKAIIFIGDNGAGKTTLLDALKINLSWLVARINRDKGNGCPLADTDVQNGQTFTDIALQLQYAGQGYSWRLAKTLKGRLKTTGSQLDEVSHLAHVFREQLTKDISKTTLPLLVYYPVERTVPNIRLENQVRLEGYNQLNGYDNALQGLTFRHFFEWFYEREAYENEMQMHQYQQFFGEISDSSDSADLTQLSSLLDSFKEQKDPQLTAVRSAIKTFMTDFERLRIEHNPLRMLIDKNGTTLDAAQLSQGEKSMMALVGDIARRLAMMNPGLVNPLEGFGIVLIDEIDLHLHPKWQRSIVSNLNRTFPNCQFILTTHSPIVISDSPHLLCYSLNGGDVQKLHNLYGMDVNQVLLQDMDALIRNADIQQALDDLLDSLQDGRSVEAKALLAELEQKIAIDNLELSKAKLLMLRLEAQRAAHH